MVIPGSNDDTGSTGLRIAAAAPSTSSEPLATLATIVRTLGVVGVVDPADRADRVVLDAWARHVETGAAAPGLRRRGAPAAAELDRDWTGLCGAVTRSLESRAARCTRTIEDLQTKLAVAHHDRREQEDRDVMDDLSIREHARQLARAAERDDALALRALVHDATTKLMLLLDERCARRNQRALDDLDEGALVDEFSGVDDDEPTVPALRSPLAAVGRPAVTRWRQ